MQPIVGIDQSTRASGWAIITPEGSIAEYGVLKTPRGKTGLVAALWQAHAIEEFLLLRGLQHIGLENLFFSDNYSKDTIFLLGALRGMVVLAAEQNNIVYHTVGSPEVCRHVGCAVNANRDIKKKASRVAAAMDLWHDDKLWEEVPEDAADAIHIGMIVWKRLRLAELADMSSGAIIE